MRRCKCNNARDGADAGVRQCEGVIVQELEKSLVVNVGC